MYKIFSFNDDEWLKEFHAENLAHALMQYQCILDEQKPGTYSLWQQDKFHIGRKKLFHQVKLTIVE